MKHRRNDHRRPLRVLTGLLQKARARICTHADRARDRGANVVETIIIVAGFAILAALIYTTVSSKVHAWIAKIP